MGAEPVTLAGDPFTPAGEPVTLTRESVSPARRRARDAAPGRPRPRRDGRRPGRGVVLAVAGVAAVAGLAGWLLAGAFGAGPARQPGASRPAARPSSAPAGRTVEVNAAALAGHRASAVSHRLRQLGLRPHVVDAARGGRAPGTVISVRPSGRVPAGSTVTVTRVVRPHGHGHNHRNGSGQGNNGGD